MTEGPGAGERPHVGPRRAATPGCEETQHLVFKEKITEPWPTSSWQHEDPVQTQSHSAERSGTLPAGGSSGRDSGFGSAAQLLEHDCSSDNPGWSGTASGRQLTGTQNCSATTEQATKGETVRSLGSLGRQPAESVSSGMEQGPRQRQEEGRERCEEVKEDTLGFPLDKQNWLKLVSSTLDLFGGPLHLIGIQLLGLFIHSPAQVGVCSRAQLRTEILHTPLLQPLLKGDLLPLPLIMSVEDQRVVSDLLLAQSLPTADTNSHLDLGARCWLQVSVFTLNTT